LIRQALVWLVVSVAWLAGCAQQQRWNDELAQKQAIERKLALEQGQAGVASSRGELAFCVPPVQDPDGSTRRLDLNYQRLGLREVPSAAAATGCDVMLQLGQHSGEGVFRYEASSASSSAPLASGQVTNWLGVSSMMSDLVGKLRRTLGPGTAAYRDLMTERRKSTGVAERPRRYAPTERQQQIDQAEQEGDAAAARDPRKAFAAYTRALSGPWSDDDTSRRVRAKYMKLIGDHPDYLPSVPEEARMHMVRAKAILKDSEDFAAYDQALGEMAAAIGSAPWWSDAYYNIALVAEKAGYVSSAIGALKFYLTANPRAADARTVQDKIYALEVRLERGQGR